MLPQYLIDEVQRLLAESRLSHRAIAEALGLSRGTVWGIAHGKCSELRRRKTPAPNADGAAQGNGEDPPAVPPARCPSCGGLVYLPCRLCRVRRWQRRRKVQQHRQRRA